MGGNSQNVLLDAVHCQRNCFCAKLNIVLVKMNGWYFDKFLGWYFDKFFFACYNFEDTFQYQI